MKLFHKFIDRWTLTIWPGIVILFMNVVCTFRTVYSDGDNNMLLFANCVGITFSLRIIYDYFQFKRQRAAMELEVSRTLDKFIAELEAHKIRSDESNSDKS